MDVLLSGKIVLLGALGIAAQWIAWKFRLPALVLLIIFGVIAGPVTGILVPQRDFGHAYEVLVKLALAFVLFEGGLQLRTFELKTIRRTVKWLCTLGIGIAWLFGALAGHYLGGLSWPTAVVLAAILTVTGPTVILPILRQARLAPSPAYTLKWEGILNDPTGALLSVLSYEFFVYTAGGAASAFGDVFFSLASAVGVAVLLAVATAWWLRFVFNRDQVPEFLKIPLILGLIIAIYVVANWVQDEAGLLAVTVFGILVGQLNYPIIEELRRFKEAITVLVVSSVFILLTADLDPEALALLNWKNAALLGAFVFVIRPLSVWISTFHTGTSWRERTLVGWIAPRGVVAAGMAGLFGPGLMEAGVEDADLILPIVFSMVFITVILHGFTIVPLSRLLGLGSSQASGVLIVGASSWTVELARVLHETSVKVILADSNWHRLRDARNYGVPTFYGEVLSSSGEEHLDLSGITDLLGATENDAYNSLVCSRFTSILGSGHVLQLPLHSEDKDPKKLDRRQRGRIAIGQGVVLEKLLVDHYRGWQFHKTKITESYTLQDHLKDSGEAVLVLVLHKSGAITFNSEGQRLKPMPGDTLLSFTKE